MTRPQKESDMKREHRVTIRLTDTEFSIIENSAAENGGLIDRRPDCKQPPF